MSVDCAFFHTTKTNISMLFINDLQALDEHGIESNVNLVKSPLHYLGLSSHLKECLQIQQR